MTNSLQIALLTSRLLQLPAELVVEIVAQVANLENARKSLCSLAQTCRYLQPVAESYIYTAIEVLKTDDLLAILHAFDSRPARVETIHTLRILYKFRDDLDDTVEDRSQFNHHVMNMKALREWHIESPCDNYNWTRGGALWVKTDMDQFRQALEAASLQAGALLNEETGLGKLERLILHSHGPDSDFWDIDGFDCLFRHPRLKHLHISSVVIGSAFPKLEPFRRVTPLSTLIFDECIIKPEALDSILRTPRALKHLVLGESVWNGWRQGLNVANLSSSPDAALYALSHVSHSLVSLTHLDPLERLRPEISRLPRVKDGNMRTFDYLETIECAACSFLHHSIIMIPHRAPPHIKCVRIRGRRQRVWDQQIGAFFDELPEISQYPYLPSLKRLEFVQPVNMNAQYFTPFRVSSYLCEPDRLRERHAQAYKLWKHGINTVLYAEVHRKSSLIPPYLHGEQTPRLLPVYDAEEVGFYRKVDTQADVAPPLNLEDKSSLQRLVDIIVANHFKHGVDEATASSKPPIEKSTTKADHLPETDQLSNDDILRLRNELRRKISRCEAQMHATASDLDESDTDTETDSDGYGGLTMDEFSDVEIEFDMDDGFDEGVETDDDIDDADEDAMDDLDLEVTW